MDFTQRYQVRENEGSLGGRMSFWGCFLHKGASVDAVQIVDEGPVERIDQKIDLVFMLGE